jgi:glycosyltransferase involved in cell wall biosynthesis
MKIGIASPVSLTLLASLVRDGESMPEGYPFPFMAHYVEELVRRGHHVSLFTLAPQLSEPLLFEGDQLRIHIGRLRPGGRARDFFAKERQELIKAMSSDPVDVLHAHWTYEFALAALQTPAPVLVTAHDAPLNIFRYSPDAYRFIRLLLAGRVSHQTQHMTAVSPYIQRHFHQVFGYPREIDVIPNGMPDSIYKLNQPSSKNTKRKIIFAAVLTGWSKIKNGSALLKAFALARSNLPESELWLYGIGHGVGEQAQRWAEKHRVTQSVVFHGRTPYDHLIQQLKSSVDVLVHPALEESFSMAVAEAMALGIPVIGGDHSGAVPDTLGGSGLLVDVRSPNQIAIAMITLAKDGTLRDKLSRAGNLLAQNKYSLSVVADSYETLYTRFLGPKIHSGPTSQRG